MQASPQLLQKVNISDRLEKLLEDSTEAISALTSQLNHISSDFIRSRLDDPFPDPLQFPTNHQLFKVPVEPRYNAIESTDSNGKDKYHLESMVQAQITPAQRLAVAPAGVWYRMGIISQHNLPPQPFSAHKANIEMISFIAEAGYERLVWGKNPSSKDGEDDISLFINLEKSKHSEEKTEAQIALYLREFLNDNSSCIRNLSYRRIVGPSLLDRLPNIEITIFDVAANDQRSFEYAYSNYTQTTHQQNRLPVLFSPWCAIRPLSRGWVYPSGKQAETVSFVGTFCCHKKGAREEWYGDFAKRAQAEYDLLGHIVDWLRILSTSISVHYVVFEREEDPWMTADKAEEYRLEKEASRIAAEKLEDERRAQAVVPPSIFDLPWGKGK
ncbi:hypothetical protein CNMCM7691_000389 [Aspergillus felis]|uniref:Uncharacterized protein n=1 Tax=Aspergillus felis TaxID=1287682 RepID=A0A8H6V2S1_9EURO|nr:hypothetical protein CNMCM7691_000389 [Aspergillus felis]